MNLNRPPGAPEPAPEPTGDPDADRARAILAEMSAIATEHRLSLFATVEFQPGRVDTIMLFAQEEVSPISLVGRASARIRAALRCEGVATSRTGADRLQRFDFDTGELIDDHDLSALDPDATLSLIEHLFDAGCEAGDLNRN